MKMPVRLGLSVEQVHKDDVCLDKPRINERIGKAIRWILLESYIQLLVDIPQKVYFGILPVKNEDVEAALVEVG